MNIKMHIESTRFYSAHHMLLRISEESLERAKYSSYANTHDILISISLCALALEAVLNAIGSKSILNWEEDFESCNPNAKARIICMSLGISYEKNKEPWLLLRSLIKFRNKVAHPKSESITTNKIVDFEEFYGNTGSQPKPESKLEKLITLESAEKYLSAVNSVIEILCSKLDEDVRDEIKLEFWTTTASSHPPSG